MDTPPGKVIRSLRQALDMTQAEFARAAGWSASTISSWERGTTTPSRLAFKTILAFAEERGVRWQPKHEDAGRTAPASPGTLPVLRLSSRLPAPMALDAEPASAPGAAREESFGSRRWTEVAASRPLAYETRVAGVAERPEWQVEARVALRIGGGAQRARRGGYVAATLAALVVGLGVGAWLRTGASAPTTTRARPAVEPLPAVRAARPVPPVEVDQIALGAFAAPLAGPPLALGQPALDPDPAPPREMPAPSQARLESIVALDGVRRASFRVGDRSIALVEGDQLGARAVALIENDQVTLVGGGVAERVRLGLETAIQ